MGPGSLRMEQILKDEIFDGKDYAVWKARLENLFKRRKLLCVLEKRPQEEHYFLEPENETADEKETRSALVNVRISLEEEALEIIHRRLDNEQFKKVIELTTVKDIISKFDSLYKRTGPQVRSHLRDQLQGLKNREFANLKELFDNFDQIIREMEAANYNLPKIERIHYFLESIPKDYAQLVSHYEFLDDEAFKNLSFSEMKSKFFNSELKVKHVFPETPVTSNAFVANKPTRKRFKCYNCGIYGHKSFECPHKSVKLEDHESFVKRRKFYTERLQSFFAGQPFTCCLDSGASNHMVNDESILGDIKILKDPIEVNLAKKDETVTATKKGKLQLKSCVGLNKINDIEFYDVLFTPNLAVNLISVTRIESNGFTVIFKNGLVSILDKNDNVLITGKRINGLYYLDLFLCGYERAFMARVMKGLSVWHKKLGHLSNANMLKIVEKNMATGFEMKMCRQSKEDFVCDSCVYGKQTRDKFKILETPRSSRPLEIVHSDVWGPFATETYDRKRYYVTFIDDFTHFTCVYLIKNKSEVFEMFKIFDSMAVAHFNLSISRLRCDNGGEYIGINFLDFCRKKGIICDFTVPYTPQLNGVSERMNRTLVDKARTMLIDSKLPKMFWGDAILTAAYLTNRSPTRTLHTEKTPYEMWTKQKPNFSKLQIFGSVVFAHIPKEKRDKLDPKSSKCYFLGYNTNSYRLWDIKNKKVIISRDIVVDYVFKESVVTETSDQEYVSNEYDKKMVEKLTELVSKNSCQADDICLNEREDIGSTDSIQPEANETVDTNFEQSEFVSENGIISNENSETETEMVDINSNSITLRRSDRIRKKPDKLIYTSKMAVAMMVQTFINNIPQKIHLLKERDDWFLWKQAIENELLSLEENKTWTIIDRIPEDKKAILSKWVFCMKESEGAEKYKARLVAKGCSQRPGFDFDETFSPVVKITTIRIMLCIANEYQLYVHQMDVKSAYLNGNLEEEVYMKLPNDEIGQNRICRLNKSLYGLKQSGRAWFLKFNDAMKGLGFKNIVSDACLYQNTSLNIFVLLYVDDILIFGKLISNITLYKEKITSLFKMKDMGEVQDFLGLKISRNMQNREMTISQRRYIEKILCKFGMEHCNPCQIPIDVNIKNDEITSEQTNAPFRELIGSLQYLVLVSRPDIAVAVNYYSKFQEKPEEIHFKGLKRILRYLKGTIDHKLVYKVHENSNCLVGYADASYGNDTKDRKSISGYIYKLFGNTVSWSTKKQSTISESSTEAELLALSHASKEGRWIKNLLNEIGINFGAFTIYEDNIPCINIAEEPRSHQRCKHVDIKYMKVRELVQEKIIDLKYLSTTEQVADVMTKPLPLVTFQKHLNNLGVLD